MELKKTLLGNVVLTLVGAMIFSLVAFSNDGNSYLDARGDSNPYSIVLETNKNKIGTEAFSPPNTYSGNGTVTTELGNSVAFEYNGLYNPTTMWQTIKAGGYITNTQPIMGMTSITLTKNSSAANFGIYWSNTTTFTSERYQLFDTSSPLITVCSFAGYMPNYIKIAAIEDSSINSGIIEFSCQNNYPIQKGGTTQFGTYPQSKVTDGSLISTLNSAAGTLPSSGNNQSWTSYGYYIEGSVSSFMWYFDLVYMSNEYRGVYFTSYRPYFTTGSSITDYSYQDNNGYSTGFVYWFKYEPITWRVLDIQTGKAFLMANLVLDSQDYYYSTANRTIASATVYANNYKESHIRSWLNASFFDTAFTTEEKNGIQTTSISNNAASTGFNPNPYTCESTSDKVFLLSYVEATSTTYNLNTTASRQVAPSAYAKSQGVYTYSNGFNYWRLRSPFNENSGHDTFDMEYVGNGFSNSVLCTHTGVVPALWISLQ